jgi:hypothetical protein
MPVCSCFGAADLRAICCYGSSNVTNPDAELQIIVWDDQFISNDLLGKVHLPLSGLIDQRIHHNWHPLMGKSLRENYVCTLSKREGGRGSTSEY